MWIIKGNAPTLTFYWTGEFWTETCSWACNIDDADVLIEHIRHIYKTTRDRMVSSITIERR